MTFTSGVCLPWDVDCTSFPDEPTPEEQEWIDSSIQAATEVLWARTKYRFGICEVTLRPCHEDCTSRLPWVSLGGWHDVGNWSWPFPTLHGGMWFNMGCGSCADSCGCGATVSELRLPYPVFQVTRVTIDDQILSPSAYRVDNNHLLVRVDGGEWPRCNDLGSNVGELGTWAVTAAYGEDVPALGRLAVGQLASELYKACAGVSGCALPAATIKQINRQGVTKVFFDGPTAFKSGMTGLYHADLFIKTYNPSGTGLANIFNIDGPRRWYTSSP